mgnify:CR=1 FL=1
MMRYQSSWIRTRYSGSSWMIWFEIPYQWDIDNKYITIGSRKSTYSAYRKFIRNSGLINDVKNESLKILKLSKDEFTAYSNDKIDKVNFKLEHLKVINDIEGYIEMGISLIKKPSYIDKILGFCCVTGRRPAEIGCSSDFSFVDINHLEFSGQLKTKSPELKSYVIPCLMNTSDFLRYFHLPYQIRSPSCPAFCTWCVKVHRRKTI